MRSNGALILNGRDLLPTFGSSQKLEKNSYPFAPLFGNEKVAKKTRVGSSCSKPI
jgi:hypothetical protein